MLTAAPAPEHAAILAVGPHDGSAFDSYELLLAAVAVEVPGRGSERAAVLSRTGGALLTQGAEALAAAVTALGNGRRRRR